MKLKVGILLAILATTTLGHAECGIEKPLKITVLKSFHKEKVPIPLSGCKTAEGSCKASGTIYVVSTKKVKYEVILVEARLVIWKWESLTPPSYRVVRIL